MALILSWPPMTTRDHHFMTTWVVMTAPRDLKASKMDSLTQKTYK